MGKMNGVIKYNMDAHALISSLLISTQYDNDKLVVMLPDGMELTQVRLLAPAQGRVN